MSLPAYMFLYDENGNPIKGSSNVAGREGAIEILNSNYHINQVCCSNTGKLMGAREHGAFNIHKQIDKTSPYFAYALCQSKRLKKAVIHYYDVNEAGFEYEVYRITLDSIVIISVDAAHTWVPGSRGHNMLESISIRYHGIEWFYLDGNIKYEDSWNQMSR
ncbi:type VI secretion system tube protein Hcp [Enterobacter sp. MW07]|nr:type VI secretion system tube protein Hcp [Enterobacter sp. MW07]